MSELGVVVHSTRRSCMQDVRTVLAAIRPRAATAGQLRQATGWSANEISACLAKLIKAGRVKRFHAIASRGPYCGGYAYTWVESNEG
ncbi:MAG: hypothetical protein HY856_13495 [Burkholderiales bacterium]|nr:hypothetical protein [Burkholderiales bacterium]